MKRYHLAVDIGASSGRHVLGTVCDGKIHLEEIYRFENRLIHRNGHLCWDMEYLCNQVMEGIRKCGKTGKIPESIGIDTWGVDYVLLDASKNVIGDCISYRDDRTSGMKEKLEQRIPFCDLYARTGIQYQKFNTVYQLLAQKQEHPEQIAQAEYFLMVPDYLNWQLTGIISNEYTNVTTTSLINAQSKVWDEQVISAAGIPHRIFREIQKPGTVLGCLRTDVQNHCGFNAKVILPATHDTGSAFLAVPAEEEDSIILSSGTWSLMGLESLVPLKNHDSEKDNFTNEGGYDYRFRYLKNIMGLWMVQCVRNELMDKEGQKESFPQLIQEAETANGFSSQVNPGNAAFLAPKSMIDEIQRACRESGQSIPKTTGEILQVIYQSLAEDYANVLEQIQKNTGRRFKKIQIVGGGSQDTYLNQMCADRTRLDVEAGPTECTVLGNLIVQWIAFDEFHDLKEARKAVRNSFEIRKVKPR